MTNIRGRWVPVFDWHKLDCHFQFGLAAVLHNQFDWYATQCTAGKVVVHSRGVVKQVLHHVICRRREWLE